MALLEKNEKTRKEAESKPKEEVKKEETKDTPTSGEDLAKEQEKALMGTGIKDKDL